MISFNPYSVGCCSGSNLHGDFDGIDVKFQSLFCWMLFWKTLACVKLTRLLIGFNPYSVGCCSGSRLQNDAGYQYLWFQSLFCWMLFWKKKTRVCWPIIRFCFNPYSVGCCSGRRRGRTRYKQTKLVSILILLDVVLEVLPLPSEANRAAWFQSLFCWMLFWKN